MVVKFPPASGRQRESAPMIPAKPHGTATPSAPRTGTLPHFHCPLPGAFVPLMENVAGRIWPTTLPPWARQRAHCLRPEAGSGLLDHLGPSSSSHLVPNTLSRRAVFVEPPYGCIYVLFSAGLARPRGPLGSIARTPPDPRAGPPPTSRPRPLDGRGPGVRSHKRERVPGCVLEARGLPCSIQSLPLRDHPD